MSEMSFENHNCLFQFQVSQNAIWRFSRSCWQQEEIRKQRHHHKIPNIYAVSKETKRCRIEKKINSFTWKLVKPWISEHYVLSIGLWKDQTHTHTLTLLMIHVYRHRAVKKNNDNNDKTRASVCSNGWYCVPSQRYQCHWVVCVFVRVGGYFQCSHSALGPTSENLVTQNNRHYYHCYTLFGSRSVSHMHTLRHPLFDLMQ